MERNIIWSDSSCPAPLAHTKRWKWVRMFWHCSLPSSNHPSGPQISTTCSLITEAHVSKPYEPGVLFSKERIGTIVITI